MLAGLLLIAATSVQPADLHGVWTFRFPALKPYTLVGRWTDTTQSGERSIRYGETTGGARMFAYRDPGDALYLTIYNDEACLWLRAAKQSRSGRQLRGWALIRGGNCEPETIDLWMPFRARFGGHWDR